MTLDRPLGNLGPHCPQGPCFERKAELNKTSSLYFTGCKQVLLSSAFCWECLLCLASAETVHNRLLIYFALYNLQCKIEGHAVEKKFF